MATHERSRWSMYSTRIAPGIAALALAACAGGGEGETTQSIRVALLDADIAQVGLLETFERLEADGITVELTRLAEPELAIEGLANGSYDVSAESTSPALIGIERGADIKIIADVIGTQFAVYGREDIVTCEDLDGEPLGLLSEGAVATAMIREWLAQDCSEVEPTFLVAGAGPVRMQALISGELAATPLQVADEIALRATGQEVNQLVNFGEALPDLNSQTVYARQAFLDESPEAASALVQHLVTVMGEMSQDPSTIIELVEKHVPDFADENLTAIADRYVEDGLFDPSAMTEESIAYTVEFFRNAGVISENLSVDDVADLTFLNDSRG